MIPSAICERTNDRPNGTKLSSEDISGPLTSAENQEKSLSSLDDGELRNLLEEAVNYKRPSDRYGKSILFNELLQVAEADERDQRATNASGTQSVRHYNTAYSNTHIIRNRKGKAHNSTSTSAANAAASCKQSNRNQSNRSNKSAAERNSHGGSLQNIYQQSNSATSNPRKSNRNRKYSSSTVSARQRVGGSLPSCTITDHVSVDNYHNAVDNHVPVVDTIAKTSLATTATITSHSEANHNHSHVSAANSNISRGSLMFNKYDYITPYEDSEQCEASSLLQQRNARSESDNKRDVELKVFRNNNSDAGELKLVYPRTKTTAPFNNNKKLTVGGGVDENGNAEEEVIEDSVDIDAAVRFARLSSFPDDKSHKYSSSSSKANKDLRSSASLMKNSSSNAEYGSISSGDKSQMAFITQWNNGDGDALNSQRVTDASSRLTGRELNDNKNVIVFFQKPCEQYDGNGNLRLNAISSLSSATTAYSCGVRGLNAYNNSSILSQGNSSDSTGLLHSIVSSTNNASLNISSVSSSNSSDFRGKKGGKPKPKTDRNVIDIDPKQIEGFCGDLDVEVLVKFIEATPKSNQSQVKNKSSNQNAAKTNFEASGSAKKRAAEKKASASQQKEHKSNKLKKSNSLEELSSATKLEDLTSDGGNSESGGDLTNNKTKRMRRQRPTFDNSEFTEGISAERQASTSERNADWNAVNNKATPCVINDNMAASSQKQLPLKYYNTPDVVHSSASTFLDTYDSSVLLDSSQASETADFHVVTKKKKSKKQRRSSSSGRSNTIQHAIASSNFHAPGNSLAHNKSARSHQNIDFITTDLYNRFPLYTANSNNNASNDNAAHVTSIMDSSNSAAEFNTSLEDTDHQQMIFINNLKNAGKSSANELNNSMNNRRNSICSLPHSERSNDSDDLDSVHSLPIQGSVRLSTSELIADEFNMSNYPVLPTPASIPPAASSFNNSQQASYAEIARMANNNFLTSATTTTPPFINSIYQTTNLPNASGGGVTKTKKWPSLAKSDYVPTTVPKVAAPAIQPGPFTYVMDVVVSQSSYNEFDGVVASEVVEKDVSEKVEKNKTGTIIHATATQTTLSNIMTQTSVKYCPVASMPSLNYNLPDLVDSCNYIASNENKLLTTVSEIEAKHLSEAKQHFKSKQKSKDESPQQQKPIKESKSSKKSCVNSVNNVNSVSEKNQLLNVKKGCDNVIQNNVETNDDEISGSVQTSHNAAKNEKSDKKDESKDAKESKESSQKPKIKKPNKKSIVDVAKPKKPSLTDASRPAVIIVNDKTAYKSTGITFGFDVNEKLLCRETSSSDTSGNCSDNNEITHGKDLKNNNKKIAKNKIEEKHTPNVERKQLHDELIDGNPVKDESKMTTTINFNYTAKITSEYAFNLDQFCLSFVPTNAIRCETYNYDNVLQYHNSAWNDVIRQLGESNGEVGYYQYQTGAKIELKKAE